METFRKTAAVLIFPVLAGLGIACGEKGPTGPEHGTTGIPGGGNARTHWVNDDATFPVPPGSNCSNPGYRRIQDAVNAAAAGDKIKVCAGTYPEQVIVAGQAKDNIQLISVQRWKAVIQAPPVMTTDGTDATYTIVRVTDAENVNIIAFTITGPGPAPCNSLHYGVRVDNAGSANILGNHIIHIRDNPSSACPNGVAVIVGKQTAASAKILGNVFEDYQKNGPTVTGVGSNAEISYNRILGKTPNPLQAQNGIQVDEGATATIRHNFIAQNIYTGAELAAGAGMFFSGAGPIGSDHNTVTSNDYAVFALGTGGSSVTESRLRSSTFDGVYLEGSNSNQLTHNASEHNGFTGFYSFSTAQNSLVKNRVSDNDDSGILLDNASNNNGVRENHVHNNGTPDNGADLTDGIRINAGSTGNTISDNHLKRNVTHDCHDNSYPANVWTNNQGGTSFPVPQLCGDDEADELEPISAFGWDPNYPWYTSYSEAVDFDWAVGYAEFDLDSILALLPTLRLDVGRPKPKLGH